jgi:serine/threonine-protein kinase RsbW
VKQLPVQTSRHRVTGHIDETTSSSRLALCLRGPSLTAQLGRVRARVAAWASAVGVDDETTDDMVLATHEALSNVADHAYPDGRGAVWLDAVRDADDVSVVVRDRGRWRPPPIDPGHRGHGLTLISGLAQRVAVRRGTAGTTVEMHWQLSS